MDSLYIKIRELRLEHGWTQEELARKVGYTSKSSINKIEKGLVDLPRSKVSEFAKVFNVSLSYLMGWEENQELSYIDIMKDEAFSRRKLLFDTSFKVKEEDLEEAIEVLEKFIKSRDREDNYSQEQPSKSEGAVQKYAKQQHAKKAKDAKTAIARYKKQQDER